MPDAVFLETFQLYKRYRRAQGGFGHVVGSVPRPPIHMWCPKCKAERTFNIQVLTLAQGGADGPLGDSVVTMVYRCAGGCSAQRSFLLEFGPADTQGASLPGNQPAPSSVTWVQKVGQSPRWEEHVERDVEKALGERYLDLYRRGLACENEGFGIGAYAYYRRIVESLIRDLMDARAPKLLGAELEAFTLARQELDREWSGSKAIELIRDELPEEVRRGGANPLALLYSEFSEGLHSRPDDECARAEYRELLMDVFLQLQRLKESKNFADALKAVLKRP